MRFRLLLLVFVYLPWLGFCQRTDSIMLYFDFNRAEITPGSDSVLHSYLKDHSPTQSSVHSPIPSPIQNVSLLGFCDSIGSNGYNDSLSIRRVMAVKQYLLRSLPDSIIKEVRGFGKRRPLNDNGTEKARAMNRRVVVRVQIGESPFLTVSSMPASTPPGPIHTALKDSSTTLGTSIVLKNVNFYGGRHFPLESSYVALDDLLLAMRDNPHLQIRIEGYVCCVPDSVDGPDVDTRRPNLSVARARFVYDYLEQHGIDTSRITYIGLGGANKIYPQERDPIEQQANRRVEVRVMAK